jgi:hypothetical protein
LEFTLFASLFSSQTSRFHQAVGRKGNVNRDALPRIMTVNQNPTTIIRSAAPQARITHLAI